MDGSSIAGRLAGAYRRRGTPILIRRFSTLPGPTPSPNPPTLDTPVVDGSYPEGSTTISIRAASAVGRLVAGDILTISGGNYPVAAQVLARAYGGRPGFSDVPLQQPIDSPISDGYSVSIAWSADLPVYAMIKGFPFNLQDGNLIQSRDLLVSIPAFGLTSDPQLTWRLAFNGQDYAIVAKQPVFLQGAVMSWNLQAR